jgi:hypothetical protein
MTSLVPTAAGFAVLGLLLATGANVATADSRPSAANPYDCYMDDSPGRRRSCSALYRQKRADRNPFDCSTDDGNGRRRVCANKLKR